MPHKLDTESQVFFYEQEFYVLSNFSAFRLRYDGKDFDTAEAAYHYMKFPMDEGIQEKIIRARSAHDAYKIAQVHKDERRKDWDDVKVYIMRTILFEKVKQHQYVMQKLLETGDRELIEDSWRDDFWGWGPNKDGQNALGKLWMEVRSAMKVNYGERNGRTN